MRTALLLTLFSVPVLADTVTTKDGVVHRGRIVGETRSGYLFREDTGQTGVLVFEQVDDVSRTPVDAPVRETPVVLAPVTFSRKALALHHEWMLLTFERREWSLFWPIASLSVGAVLGTVGAVVLGNAGPHSDNSNVVAGTLCGAGLLVGGGIGLLVNLMNRANLDAHIEELRVSLLTENVSTQQLYGP